MNILNLCGNLKGRCCPEAQVDEETNTIIIHEKFPVENIILKSDCFKATEKLSVDVELLKINLDEVN